MRKSKYSPYYAARPRSRPQLRTIAVGILIGIPLLLILAEFLVRGVLLVTGWEKQLSLPQAISMSQSYGLQLLDARGKPYTPGGAGQLQVRFSPIMGYELVPNQTGSFWGIDENGFRQETTVAKLKKDDEIRIFLIGNSTAFGQMTANNQLTIAAKLEKQLNARVRSQNDEPKKFKPLRMPFYADEVEAVRALPPRLREGNYRVLTAAVPGYASANELSLIAHHLMGFQPDSLIVLDGYEDLRLPSRQSAKEIVDVDRLLQQNPDANYRKYLSTQFDTWVNSFYLVKAARRWLFPLVTPKETNQSFSADLLTADAEELKARIARYQYNIAQIARLAAGIPTIVAIQPELTGKKNAATQSEKELLKQLGETYRTRVEEGYKALQARSPRDAGGKLRFVNLYRMFETFNRQAFVDPIHLTDEGNELLSKRLFTILEELFAIPPNVTPAP